MLHAHKKDSYYTPAIVYCTFSVRKCRLFNHVQWQTL